MSIDRAEKLEDIINKMNDYFNHPEAREVPDNLAGLVQEYDVIIANPKTISYLEAHPNKMAALREINNNIVEAYANTYTNVLNEDYKNVHIEQLPAEEKDYKQAHLDHLEAKFLDISDTLNSISNHATYTILTASDEERAILMERFLLIGKKLYEQGNFAAACTIFQALQGASIERLYEGVDGRQGLSPGGIQIYEEMSEVFGLLQDQQNRLYDSILMQKKGSKLPPLIRYTTRYEASMRPRMDAHKDEIRKLEENLKTYEALGDAGSDTFEANAQRLRESYIITVRRYKARLEAPETSETTKKDLEDKMQKVAIDLSTLESVLQLDSPQKRNEKLSDLKKAWTNDLTKNKTALDESTQKMGKFVKDQFDLLYKPYTNIDANKVSQSLVEDTRNREDFIFTNKLNFIVERLKPKLSSMQSKETFLSDDVPKETIIKMLRELLEFTKKLNQEVMADAGSAMNILNPYIIHLENNLEELKIDEGRNAKDQLVESLNDLQATLDIMDKVKKEFPYNLHEVSKHHRYNQETKIRRSLLHKKISDFFLPSEDKAKNRLERTFSQPLRVAVKRTKSGVKSLQARIRKRSKKLVNSKANLENYIGELKERNDVVSNHRGIALEKVLKEVNQLPSNLEKMKYLDKLIHEVTYNDKKIKIKVDDQEEDISLKEHRQFSSRLLKDTSAMKLLKAYSRDLAGNVVPELVDTEKNLRLLEGKMIQGLAERYTTKTENIKKIESQIKKIEEEDLAESSETRVNKPTDIIPAKMDKGGVRPIVKDTDHQIEDPFIAAFPDESVEPKKTQSNEPADLEEMFKSLRNVQEETQPIDPDLESILRELEGKKSEEENKVPEEAVRAESKEREAENKEPVEVREPEAKRSKSLPLPPPKVHKPLPIPSLEAVQKPIEKQRDYFQQQMNESDGKVRLMYLRLSEVCTLLAAANDLSELYKSRSTFKQIKEIISGDQEINNDEFVNHLNALEKLIHHKGKALAQQQGQGHLPALKVDIRLLQEENQILYGFPNAQEVVGELNKIYIALEGAHSIRDIIDQKDKLKDNLNTIHLLVNKLRVRDSEKEIDPDTQEFIKKLESQIAKLKGIIADATYYHHELEVAHQPMMFKSTSTPDQAKRALVVSQRKKFLEKIANLGTGMKRIGGGLGTKIKDKFDKFKRNKPGGHS